MNNKILTSILDHFCVLIALILSLFLQSTQGSKLFSKMFDNMVEQLCLDLISVECYLYEGRSTNARKIDTISTSFDQWS